jgi:hypothetical protein
MPYIKQEKRDVLDSAIDELHLLLDELENDDESNNMEGNINYAFTRLLMKCYGESYRDINNIMGVLSCVQQEFYRTIAAPYENQKRFENGEIETEVNDN